MKEMNSQYLIKFNLSNYCDQACIHCPDSILSTGQKSEVDFEVSLKKLEADIESINVGEKFVMITGGEPTLNKNLMTLLDYLEKKNAHALLVTNGLIFLRDNHYFKQIMSKKINALILSIESSQKSYQYLRQSDYYNQLKGLLKKIRLIKPNMNLMLNVVVYSGNKDTIVEDLKSLLSNKEINTIRLIFYRELANNKNQLNISNDEKANIINKIENDPNIDNTKIWIIQ